MSNLLVSPRLRTAIRQYRSGGITALVRAIDHRPPMGVYRLLHRVRRHRDPDGYTTAPLFKRIRVDPSSVYNFEAHPTPDTLDDPRITFDRGGRMHKWENAGLVVAGDWDRHITDVFAFEHAAKRHFFEGIPWEELDYYQQRCSIVQHGSTWRGCTTEEDVRAQFAAWDRLYRSLSSRGYQPSSAHSRWKWQASVDELTVNIGRDGTIIRNSSGKHRVALARLIGIDRIPARVLIRHPDWEQTRRASTAGDDDHPDLQADSFQ